MLRRIVTLVVVLCASLSAFAQQSTIDLKSPTVNKDIQRVKNRERYFGFQGYVEGGTVMWGELVDGGGPSPKVFVGCFGALNVGMAWNHLYAGLEAGVLYDTDFLYIPVGLNFKGYFTKTKVRPYLNMSLGANFDVEGDGLYGFYFRAGGGVDIKRFSVGVNYIPFDGIHLACATVGVRFGGKKY